ncbi:MAG: HD domain-containing protein [Candidatus Rokubacteria bacterium]|nr:HD domain-containing protein [Candidatus Rokubacteria bacterium]
MTATTAQVSLERFPGDIRHALSELASLLGPGASAWLVGGAVRDALLGRAVSELDVAVPSGALGLGRALAARLSAAFVVLDGGRGMGRVAAPVQLDLGDFRAPTLEEDLRARDFSVNALAVPVEALVVTGQAPVTDATGGLDDLAARRVRLCAPSAIRDDPVRALRGVRLALAPGWTLDAEVETAVRAAAPRLARVAAERVRDEIVALLGDRAAGQGLRMLDDLGVVAVLLPESAAMKATLQPAPHRFDVWEHTLRTVEAMDLLVEDLGALSPWGGELRAHLAEDLGDRLTRREALKLAALLHDVAKPETRALAEDQVRFIGHDRLGAERAAAVARRFRLSGRAAEFLARLVRQHLRPMHLTRAGTITRRARHRFFRDLGNDARDLLLLALADAAAVRGESPLAVWVGPGGEVVRTLLSGVAEEQALAAEPPLLRGEDVMAAFGLAPGPEVGRLLARAREAQTLGLVTTREEALASLRTGGAARLDSAGDSP